ncbi:ficolin-1-like [Mytilus edulis]|uniref:ficolin-1-like n=1 Tax=Mytilus edulis TaxID=6550 RepID=UPI0039F114AE
MGKQFFVSIFFAFLSVLVASHTIIDRSKVTSVSDSGVCFYGETAERILDILAYGEYSHLVPSVRRPNDCSDLDPKYDRSGVYRIYPTAGRGFNVYCDMTTDGGRWTVLIRRMDGSENYNKNWIEYENGFGDLNREFWLGNKYLNILTSTGKTAMRVDIENFKGEKKYAKYSTFKVGDAASKYRLTLGDFLEMLVRRLKINKNTKELDFFRFRVQNYMKTRYVNINRTFWISQSRILIVKM